MAKLLYQLKVDLEKPVCGHEKDNYGEKIICIRPQKHSGLHSFRRKEWYERATRHLIPAHNQPYTNIKEEK